MFGKGKPTAKRFSLAFSSADSARKGMGSSSDGKRMFAFSLRCRLGVIRGRTKDDGPYAKGGKESASSDHHSHASQRRSLTAEEYRGVTTVDLMKREGSSLGLTISGGSDKDGKPRVSNLRPGGLAARSDQLNVGDYIKSVNGINLCKLRHDEIISLLKNIGERVVLEVEYELPQIGRQRNSSGVVTKTIEVCLHKEGNSFGFVMRGGFHEDWHREKHGDALATLMQSSQEALFLIEYDVSVMEAVQQAYGPLLVEIVKGHSNASLGIGLATAAYRNRQVIIIDKIKAAGVAERCGALHLGDILLSIDGTSTDHCSLMEATQLLASAADVVKLEMLPANQSRLPIRPQETAVMMLALADDNNNNTITTTTTTTTIMDINMSAVHIASSSLHVASDSGGFSPSSTATSGFSSQGSSTLPCPGPGGSLAPSSLAPPSSPRGSTGKRRHRAKDHKSSRTYERDLQGGVFATEALSAPPVVRFIEPDSPAERLLSINGIPTEEGTLEEAHQLLRDAALANKVTVELEFDVAESVVPSSGTFHVKLPKRRGVELGITISASKKPDKPLIISDIKKGSIAHRTGTLEPGDMLLAVDNVRLEQCSMEQALQALQQAEDMVKLRIQKDEDNIDDLEMSGSIIYAVELKRYNGPLGITISGTEEPFDPINGCSVTQRWTGAIHIGDRVLAISGVSLKGKPLSEAIHLLQMAGESVTLKIKKQADNNKRDGGTQQQQQSVEQTGFLSDPDDLLADDLLTDGQKATGGSSRPLRGVLRHRSQYRLGPELLGRLRVRRRLREWRHTKHRSNPASIHQQHGASYDRRFTEEDWDKLPGFVSPPRRCHGALNQGDSFWSQALQDLETCGQSEILRELEASMTSSNLSLYLDETKSQEDSVFQTSLQRRRRRGGGEGPCGGGGGGGDEEPRAAATGKGLWSRSTRTGPATARDAPGMGGTVGTDALSPTSLELHKVTLRKDHESCDFGFSVSDGLLEKGVFVNMIRPDGPADQAGLRPYDRILQVNCVRTRDFDCCLTIPLIMESGDGLNLVISRSPPGGGDNNNGTTTTTTTTNGLPGGCEDHFSAAGFCVPERRSNSVAL
ncbi:hypothetical protein CRUP_000293 [Coryphaenoides rupestris]|nr:hypothetical protein CRUP_000293 [Coryphaenoides rupestris]